MMAKQKGDKGMLPFLESIGLTLSSATHLARYLSSNSLPILINKVSNTTTVECIYVELLVYFYDGGALFFFLHLKKRIQNLG